MGLLRCDVVDAGVVVLRVVPGKVLVEVYDGLAVVEEATRIGRSAFHRAERGFNEGIVIRGSGAREELGHAVVCTEFLNRLGLHLAAPVVDEFGPLVFGQIQNVLRDQAALQQESGFFGGLLPTNAPLDGFARVLVEQ